MTFICYVYDKHIQRNQFQCVVQIPFQSCYAPLTPNKETLGITYTYVHCNTYEYNM